ncbi:MAG: hypothetical protein LBN09_02660 [Clostridioides sp.]|jgi:hypothetical protein|nr:hypothetical protein [Clostridioides sp.]
MAKKRKLKKPVAIVVGIAAFFIIYFIAFQIGSKLERDAAEVPKTAVNDEDIKKPLISQLKAKEKLYISDGKASDVRIEDDTRKEILYSFEGFKEVRKPDSYKSIYEGYSDDGLKFSTDLNYFRVYTVSKEQYFKVPIAGKKQFKGMLDKAIYTSFDLITKTEKWKEVELKSGKETKKIHKWKFGDLSHKMVSKRIMGKVQPEKNRDRSKYNFEINIDCESYKIKIETMGREYVKITCKDTVAYYEVYTGMFDYLKNDIFEIK